jgi:hypothetical protein
MVRCLERKTAESTTTTVAAAAAAAKKKSYYYVWLGPSGLDTRGHFVACVDMLEELTWWW